MRDIENRADIEKLVNAFYKTLLVDPELSVFFTEIVVLDHAVHMPLMYDFWDSILLGSAKYKGNAMKKHLQLNELKSLKAEHFQQWLRVWEQTARANFKGARSDEAINRAKQIAELMQYKIEQQVGKGLDRL